MKDWKLQKNIDGENDAVCSSESLRWWTNVVTGYQKMIAKVWGDSKEEALANAKLIAAAPDLLKSLGFIMSEIDSNPMSVQFFDLRLISEAKEAIKKATEQKTDTNK